MLVICVAKLTYHADSFNAIGRFNAVYTAVTDLFPAEGGARGSLHMTQQGGFVALEHPQFFPLPRNVAVILQH